jgi:hypothetical protein
LNAEDIEPIGHTELGAPYFAFGRFDRDEKFLRRVAELSRTMPEFNAKTVARKERAEELRTVTRPQRRTEPLRTPAEKADILAAFDLGKAA